MSNASFSEGKPSRLHISELLVKIHKKIPTCTVRRSLLQKSRTPDQQCVAAKRSVR